MKNWVAHQLPSAVRDHSPLPVEASHRVFYRVDTDTGRFVVMSSPPELENNTRFVEFARRLLDLGIPVPQILAFSPAHGYVLMTDLGDSDLRTVYETPDRDAALNAALDVLITLQQAPIDGFKPYSLDRLHDELAIFSTFLAAPAVHRAPDSRDALADAFARLAERVYAQPRCLIHRDFHCRNLLFNNDRLGVVDFQDALIGPASYDIASLLHDCYYEFSDTEREHWLATFQAASPHWTDLDTLRHAVEVTALQRQLKALGIFARLHQRDGKSSHLVYIQPVARRAQKLAARHRTTAAIAAWLGDNHNALEQTVNAWQAEPQP